MVTTYDLADDSWFTRLYSLKEKWCTALNKKFFSAGIKSSQRSESTNNSIGSKARKDTNLTAFYEIFKNVVKSWRDEEEKDNFGCSRSRPESIFPMYGMIKHASEVYTLALFRDFEREFRISINASFKEIDNLDTTKVYDVKSIDGPSCRVTFDSSMKFIICDCMKYEESGMLCYHCLRVLNVNSVERIPDAYILNRWTKLARLQVLEKVEPQTKEKEKSECIIWTNDMSRKQHNLLLLGRGNEAARKIIEEGNKRDLMAVKEVMCTEQEETSAQSTSSRTIQDPTRSITKGRSKRKKGHFEKSRNKRTSSTQSAPNLEFGSKTPRPHLI